MSAGETQFRTAAFGGFQKQDVLNYIETAAREHTEKLSELQREVEQLRRDKEALEAERSGWEERLSALTKEKTTLEWELSAREEQFHQARTEAEDKARRLSEAEALVERQAQRLRQVEPAAEAYESVKDRTAGVELEAHYRAQAVEEEARQKARETMESMEQWLSRVQEGYDRLRTDLDATVAHAAGELERLKEGLSGLTGEFEQHETALEQLAEECRSHIAPPPPQPLPLDGE